MRRETYVPVRARGIPALARVSVYEPGKPAIIHADPGKSVPPDPGSMDYELCDSRGRPAPWLERGMTCTDVEDVDEQVMKYFEEQAQVAAEAAAEAREERWREKQHGS